MKTFTTGLLLVGSAIAEPIVDSWFTDNSGQYARIWQTITDETSERSSGTVSSVTTWDRTDYPANSAGFSVGDQTEPSYVGIQGVLYSTDYVYIKTTGLGTYTMGPWYGEEKTDAFSNVGTGTLFASWPGNQALLYRFERDTSEYTQSYTNPSPTATNIGNCGLFVDGIPLYNTLDTFSYDTSAGGDQGPGNTNTGDGFWNRDAFVNEGITFDSGNMHQAMENMHGHASPMALRYQLGDNVSYDSTVTFTGLDVSNGDTSPYSENTTSFTHSPILAWANDGIPMYGPYGYSDPLDATSDVRRMISGYQERDGTNGSVNLTVTGRTTLPQWKVDQDSATTSTVIAASVYGPNVSTDFILGHYIEDYAFKGDLGLTEYSSAIASSTSFNENTYYDLNEYNVRWCVTPEFPSGTWAYFTNVDSDGVPVFPYNLAYLYFGDSTKGSTTTNTDTDFLAATELFAGFQEIDPVMCEIQADDVNDEITLTWSAVEGGEYRIDTSTDLDTWDETSATFTATSPDMTTLSSESVSTTEKKFYRATPTGNYATYDDTDFGATTTGGGGGGPGGGGPGGGGPPQQ